MRKIAMSCEISEILLFQRTCSKTVLESNDIAVATCRQLSAPGTPVRKPSSNRHVKDQCVQFSNRSKCGRWAQIASNKNMNMLIDNYEKDPCGLSWLCKNCSDAFDHWYHMNLPRRIIQEPLWTGVFGFSGPDFEKEMKSLKLKLERDEKNKEKQRKKKKKMLTPSWGFRADSYVPTNLEKNREKKQRKKEKKMARKAVEFAEPKVSVLTEHIKPIEAKQEDPKPLESEIPKLAKPRKPTKVKTQPVELRSHVEPASLVKPEATKLEKPGKGKPGNFKLEKPIKLTEVKPQPLELRKPIEAASLVKPEATKLEKPGKEVKPQPLELRKPVEAASLVKPDATKLEKPGKATPGDFKLAKPIKLTEVKPQPLELRKPVDPASSTSKLENLAKPKLAEPVKPTEEVLESCKTFDMLWKQFCGDQI